MAPKTIYITKASGQKEPFAREKLEESLMRSGADRSLIQKVADEVEGRLAPGIATEKIYALAFELLRRRAVHHASRYALKRALLELGPSGHPFETFVSEILKNHGYEVEVDRVLPGFCVNHEVDIVAKKDEKHLMTEVKFHNQLGRKTDIRVALYTHARFEDIRKRCESEKGHEEEIHGAMLVTNTKFTSEAVQYGRCAGLTLLGWDYPGNGNLQSLIEAARLYPVTCLTGLPPSARRQLLNRNVLLCRDLKTLGLESLRLEGETEKRVMEELESILA
jgi:hypothetical protein